MPPAAGPAGLARDPLAGRLPVTIITGFLGSGKTTLLRRLLRHPAMRRAAVIINEFGDVGLDHELVEASSEQMTLLSNGCLCCAVRTDLQETLRELFVKRRAGEVIDFDRVFVETTGLADPAPVLHTLDSDGMLGAQYRLNGVVTLVDAVNGMEQLDAMNEAAKQAAVADRLVITKTDLADAAQAASLERRLRSMNPYALVTSAVDGRLAPELLAEIVPASAGALARDPDRWLAAAGADARLHDTDGEVAHAHRASAHDAAIGAFCLWFDQPFTWDTLGASLEVLTSLRGPDLLRVKGIVNVVGEPGPVAIHGAQHVFHPPVTLAAWHGDDRRSRIVFIVRNIPRASIEAVFAAVGALGPAAAGRH
ncbi:MAG: GTP-binding protein [Burkholderiales bacterium]|nr:GTP-binding protein [Burkholderiales bacterium]